MNVDFLYGLLHLSFWGYAAVAFCMVQFTFMAVTLYLHRDATHRSVDLHGALRQVFRCWLWMSSGIVTKEWVAVHRKHHAHCETDKDPHSPVIFGLRTVLLQGAELYQAAARDPHMLSKYGRGTPTDWMERRVYARHRSLGIVLMVLIDLVLFGAPGILIVAVQMVANPLMAAGVINGLGHHSGYRNFECQDAARNVVPWAFLIGGEELHNNHHAFPSSAKFSVRRWEFDIGWMYLRVFQALGLARIIRVVPMLVQNPPRDSIDLETARAVIVNRMHVLRAYACQVIVTVARDAATSTAGRRIRDHRKLLIRTPILLDDNARSKLHSILSTNASLKTVCEFREQLCALWTQRMNNERLLEHLKEWVVQAEASGVAALARFARDLRGFALQPQ